MNIFLLKKKNYLFLSMFYVILVLVYEDHLCILVTFFLLLFDFAVHSSDDASEILVHLYEYGTG